MKSLTEIVCESISDLQNRWLRAREAAIRQLRPSLTEKKFLTDIVSLSEDEFEILLKGIFLNSRNLGRGYQRAFGIAWERQDFVRYLEQMGTPCAQGEWTHLTNASVLKRSGCDQGKLLGPRCCQYWREAFDGLVLGLSDTEHFVRHRSLPIGDSECVDLVYSAEAESQMSIQKENKWGPIPEEYVRELAETQKKFDRMGADVEFLGVRENTLFYKLAGKAHQTCGSGESIFRVSLERHIKEIFPRMILQTANPIAVYGEKS